MNHATIAPGVRYVGTPVVLPVTDNPDGSGDLQDQTINLPEPSQWQPVERPLVHDVGHGFGLGEELGHGFGSETPRVWSSAP
ncbi:hypothetical protein E1212_06540 [Jiangella ureilytica]|uniref:Uncharacterized protein n=1 Tax=Jiangella ureilytica TaxID=2530374 RepID=A0A4R4RTU0_9ACTN|nr:hypothetical protein [Jiangella ureilytica]TDC53074.1 hypothetical protein E1212_06540 [Jiangella ureilytica]